MTPESALDAIGSARVVAVVRAQSPREAIEVARAVGRAGIGGIEIALTTPDAGAVIREVRGLLPEALVGAGTVRTTSDLRLAVKAGAVFVASPGTRMDVVEGARRAGVLAIPGVLTPTEVERVAEMVPILKLFPAGSGGPSMLRALRGPFPDVRFMPTGGVTAENVREWFAAGAFAVGVGSDLSSAGAGIADVEARAARYIEAAR
jgi:2-dehydro-3-deoxyphosphogluconate aldolase/(4S)-4-hydroxy-2-oxoglutarate aldolase